MECSVRYAGSGILVTAQLIDPQSGTANATERTVLGDSARTTGPPYKCVSRNSAIDRYATA